MTTEQKIIRAKVGLLELAKQLGNVSQACKMMGYSRDSFYRFKERYDQGRELALAAISRRKPVLKNRVPQDVEDDIVAFAVEQPAFGQVRIANELRKRGLAVSPVGVRCVWLRHDLETMTERLKALEAKSAQDGLVLTEAQDVALEKAKTEKEHAPANSRASIRAYPGAPGYVLCRQHEVGRAHLPADLHRHLQQGGLRKLLRSARRRSRRPTSSMTRVIPLFESHEVKAGSASSPPTATAGVLPVSPERHEYELLSVAVEGHRITACTKTRSPAAPTASAQRFHKIVLNRISTVVAFRKKVYRSIPTKPAD